MVKFINHTMALKPKIITNDSWNNIPRYRNSNGKGPCEALLTSYYAHHS